VKIGSVQEDVFFAAITREEHEDKMRLESHDDVLRPNTRTWSLAINRCRYDARRVGKDRGRIWQSPC
jgi:hypothetical protein